MQISEYKVKQSLEVLDKIFLKGEKLYATPSFRVMNGRFDYARKIYDGDRKYLGMIRSSSFPEGLMEYVS